MNKVKKVIIIALIVIILIIIILLSSILDIIKNEREIIKLNEDVVDTSEERIKISELVTNKIEYLNISECLTRYISEINIKKSTYYGRDENNNYTIIVDDDAINTNIYNMLSEEYINKNNITKTNVRDFVYKIEKKLYYIPIEIYVKYNSENIKSYGIYGVTEDLDYNPVMESYLILNIDETNKTFSVEQLNSLDELKNIKVENVKNISLKGNNKYKEVTGIIDEALVKEYINKYKNLALGYPQLVYDNFLDNEYKQKRFGTVEKYKEYIKENREEIKKINIKEYGIIEKLDYVQYICTDQNNRYYIFNINTIFDYKMLLDNYTVNIPSFLEKYNKANSIEKGGYNIQRCIEAINNKDYKYVYNKLEDTFKNNKYKTEESFIQEIKNNLFEVNMVESFDVENEGNIYIYDLTIKNKNNAKEEKNMRIIMQLEEGTDFVMSFSFEL